jgi:hypothetical protein
VDRSPKLIYKIFKENENDSWINASRTYVNCIFSGLLLLVTQIHWITLPVFCLMAAVLPQTSGDMRLHFFALSVLSLASVLLFL